MLLQHWNEWMYLRFELLWGSETRYCYYSHNFELNVRKWNEIFNKDILKTAFNLNERVYDLNYSEKVKQDILLLQHWIELNESVYDLNYSEKVKQDILLLHHWIEC